jgi:para-nitrobenzyl esterase
VRIPGRIVAVTGGRIQGEYLEKGGAAFKGIPYAQPPVGDLRWREPMPVRSWTACAARPHSAPSVRRRRVLSRQPPRNYPAKTAFL